MIRRRLISPILLLMLASSAGGQHSHEIEVCGRLADVQAGDLQPVYLEDVELKIVAGGFRSVTTDGGVFCLRLPHDRYRYGMKVVLGHDKEGFVFYRPLRGELILPEPEAQPIELHLLLRGSPMFKAHEYLSQLLESIANQSSREPLGPEGAEVDRMEEALARGRRVLRSE